MSRAATFALLAVLMPIGCRATDINPAAGKSEVRAQAARYDEDAPSRFIPPDIDERTDSASLTLAHHVYRHRRGAAGRLAPDASVRHDRRHDPRRRQTLPWPGRVLQLPRDGSRRDGRARQDAHAGTQVRARRRLERDRFAHKRGHARWHDAHTDRDAAAWTVQRSRAPRRCGTWLRTSGR